MIIGGQMEDRAPAKTSEVLPAGSYTWQKGPSHPIEMAHVLVPHLTAL